MKTKYDYDAVVIGAGITGLVAAATLAKHGKRVLVIEGAGYIGGRAATRTAKEWGWGDSKERMTYGPHILPTGGRLSSILAHLGAMKNVRLRRLGLPQFYMRGRVIAFPSSLLNVPETIRFYGQLKRGISGREVLAFARLGALAVMTSEKSMIERYEGVSCEKLVEDIGIRSAAAKSIVAGIIGGYCFNDDIRTCPALDLLINLKMFIRGMATTGTIMYYVEGGFGRVCESLARTIEGHGGEIMLDEPRTRIKGPKDGDGIALDIGKRHPTAKNVIYTGGPRGFKQFLKRSGLDYSFLKDHLSIPPAKILDLMVVAKKRMHHVNAPWLSVFTEKGIGYVIVDEEPKRVPPYAYHVCVILNNKPTGKRALIRLISDDMKRFGFDLGKDAEWHKAIEMGGYGLEKSIALPYRKRIGPETPHRGLYWIGDSKILEVGTDGCARAASEAAHRILRK